MTVRRAVLRRHVAGSSVLLLLVSCQACAESTAINGFWRIPEDAIRIPLDTALPNLRRLDQAKREHLERARRRLVAMRPLWSVGAVDGEVHERWAFPSSAATDRAGNIYVLDRFLTEVRVFAPDGQFMGSTLRAGDGPLEMRTPLGVSMIPGDTLIVYAHDRIQLVTGGPTSFEQVGEITARSSVTAVCQADRNIVTRVAPFDRAGTVRVLDRAGEELNWYGSMFDHSRDDVSALFSMGGLGCAGPYVSTYFDNMPLLYGYHGATGEKLWTAFLEDFTFPEVQLHDGGGIGRNSKGAEDMVLGMFGVGEGLFLVQVNRIGPASEENGRQRRQVYRRDTYVVLAASGSGVYVGEGLPHIIGVSADRIQAITGEVVPAVTNFAW